jgi:hypothetical protein
VHKFELLRKLLVCGAVVASLVSCGGGGGGVSTSTSAPTEPDIPARPLGSVQFDTSDLKWAYIQGQTLGEFAEPVNLAPTARLAQFSTVDLTNVPEDFFVGYLVDDLNFSNYLDIDVELVGSNQIKFLLKPRPNLLQGTYYGTFFPVACYLNEDGTDCEQHLSGSPAKPIKYSLTVYPKMFVSEDAGGVVFHVSQGSNTPTTGKMLGLSQNFPPGDLVAEVRYPGAMNNWLTVSRSTQGFDLSVLATNFPLGNYSATVVVTSIGSKQTGSAVVSLTVNQNSFSAVQDRPVLQVTDETTDADLQFEIPVGLSNNLSVPWRATSTAPWIVFNKSSGLTGESILYSVSKELLGRMPIETRDALVGATATITVSHVGALTVDPLSFPVKVHRLTSALVASQSGPIPVNTKGYFSVFDGINVHGGTALETVGPSPLALTTDGFIQTMPTVPGVYQVRTVNALSLPSNAVTVTFSAPSNHTYSFLPGDNLKRSLAYDQTHDALYVTDKTNNRIVRHKHSSGSWATSTLALQGVSDIGLSFDRKRLYATQTNGVLSRIAADSFTLQSSFNYGKPIPEYKKLSQGLVVFGPGTDVVPLLTDYTSTGGLELSGMVMFSSDGDRFTPVQRSYGDYGYAPERGGWFSRSFWPAYAYFVQAQPRELAFGNYVGLLSPGSVTPAQEILQFGRLPFFYTLDVGQNYPERISAPYGLVDRQSFSDVFGFNLALPGLPSNYTVVGSVLSPDWRFAYLLAYPLLALNGDQPTTLKPRVFVYELFQSAVDSQAVILRPEYFDIDHFPTCRRAQDSTCNLDTVSAATMDGRTIFFAGDKGIAVVPVPAAVRAFPSAAGTSLMRSATTNKTMSSKSSDSRNKLKGFGYRSQ